MRTVRSKTLANAMDQKTRSNRALGKQNREQLSEESRFHKSREIAENLMATAVWKQAKQVLLYASYGSEVSTGLLIDAALATERAFMTAILVKFLLPTDLILSGSAFPASCSRYLMGKNRMISTWI